MFWYQSFPLFFLTDTYFISFLNGELIKWDLHSRCNPVSFIICDCFSLLKPFLEKYLKLQDTCGIHNLHAVPGMLGGFIGAIVAAAASESVYGEEGWVSKTFS